ncbi:MAG: ComF family protein [Treponema sp.]|nr:ComF family protein [Treponema sp.]
MCGMELLDINETWYGLCETCLAGLRNDIAWMDSAGPWDKRCTCCGKPMVSGIGQCLSCRNGPEPSCDRMLPVFNYSGKYRRLYTAYKFGKNISLGHFFAEIIIKACRIIDISASGNPGIIVPVPPRPGKIKRAGWDQIEYLARLIESGRDEPGHTSMPGFEISRCLKRLSSDIQKNLARRDRLTNLKGRIITIRNPPRTAIIIDDVITTGSTIEACASVLKAGGAEKVYAICIVYD